MSDIVDVAIVGCGPVGAFLGNLLARRGHSVLILERQPAPYPLPRAIHFDGEAMRGFQAAGLAGPVLAGTLVGKGMLFRDAAGKLLADWSRDQEPGATGWHESYRFHQPTLEAALRAGLRRFDHAELREGCEVVGLRDHGDAVGLTLSARQAAVARIVVGCDGAHSMVAEAIGAGVDDLGFDERWIVADLRLTDASGDLGDRSIQFCDSEAPATYVRGIADWRRWEARLMPDDPADMDPMEAWQRLAERRGIRGVRVERAAIYRFRSRVARSWRKGRVFIAGDAAHLMPPFMGQGMCAGIRDAANLGWKLSASLSGRGGEALLDSYASERRSNVRAFIARSVALGRLINRSAGPETAQTRMVSIWPPLGDGIGPRDGIGGMLWPQLRLADGRLSDDVAGHGFHVIAADGVTATLPTVRDTDRRATPRDLVGAVVRPDGYALGGFTDAGQLAALEAQARALAPAPVVD